MLIVLAGASLFMASACSGDDGPSEYNDETRSNFTESCEVGLDAATCGCMYDKITEIMEFDEFKKLDEDLQEDPSTPLPPEVEEAMTTCVTGG
jgi:hypothetical protein